MFLLMSILFTSFNGLLHRTVMKRQNANPITQTIVFATLGSMFAFLVSLYKGFHFPNFTTLFPNFFLLTILLTLAPFCLFRAYNLTKASEVGILLSSQRLWTVLASFVFLGEIATPKKILGTLFILLGVGVVSWKKHRIRFTQGELFALLAALLYGLSFVNAFYILQSYDAPSFEVVSNLLPVMTLLLLFPQAIKKMNFYRNPRNFLPVSLAALFDALAAICLYIAYQYGRNASQISPLSSTSLIFTVFLAAIFLRERDNLLNKLTGAIITVFGVILLL